MKPELDESVSRFHPAIAGRASAEAPARAMPPSEVPISSLLDTVPALMWAATPDGSPSYLSQRCVEYTGRSLSDFLRLGWLDLIHPADREETLALWSHAIRSASSYQAKHRIRRADGEYRWFLARGEPLRDREGRVIQFFSLSMEITEQKRAEEDGREHLWFLESMDRVNRAMQRTNDVEGMTSGVLEEALAIFDSDRAWLVYPCDPDAPSCRVVMKHARPEYPAALEVGDEFPVDAQEAASLRRALEAPGAVDLDVPPDIRERFNIQSVIAIAIRPKGDRPYLFGLHQCSHARTWSAAERRLFEEIARRLEDALTSVLSHRNLLAREEELRRSRAYLAEAQKVSHTGSFAWNPVMRQILYWSEECFRIFGRDPAQGLPSIGQVLADIHPEDRPGIVAKMEETLREGREWRSEYRLVNFAAGPRTVRCVAHPIRDGAGRVLEYVGTAMDITEQKRAGEELRTSELERARAEQALGDAREKLAQASRVASLAELSASIAHEINQPLQAILANGCASLRWLDATPPNIEKAIRTAKRIVRDGNAAAEVVSRIRALFRHAAPAKVDLDINSLILQVRNLMGDEIQRNEVLLETELGEDLPRIRADAVQIQQVIVNLVRNAIEAMAEAPRKPLAIRSRRSASHVVVDVRDEGTGLVDPGKIFEPFVSTKPTGMGMGLPICRSIVEAHGGGIWVVRNEGPGVTFSFSLPIEAAKAA